MAFDERRLRDRCCAGHCLEAMIHEPAAPACAALVLHPHPQYGGDMHNHVVEALSSLCARDATTLRFNFRGAGRSSGAYAGGRGEVDDARAALAELRRAAPDAPVALAGYSFGAQIAAVLAADEPVEALLLVSPPLMDGRPLPISRHRSPCSPSPATVIPSAHRSDCGPWRATT